MSAQNFDVDKYQAMFPEEPLDGPARLIYQLLLMSRPDAKSCAAAIKQALATQFPTSFPADAPQLVVPEAVRRDVDCKPLSTPGRAGMVRSLVCRPKSSRALPVLVYFHGGGWSLGDPQEAELLTRKLALVSNCVVISVDYRLVPEHPYPAGLDDCVAVYEWARTQAGSIGGDPERVAVGGDSAGGNLAPALTLRVRDEGGRVPDANLLICPATDMLFEKYESFRRFGTRGLLYDAAFIGAVRNFYVPYPLWPHPYVSPMNGDLRDFPPTLIVAATADPLIDDNRCFFQKLREAGNQDVYLREFKDMPHAFYYFLGLTQEEDDAYRTMGDFLRRVLA